MKVSRESGSRGAPIFREAGRRFPFPALGTPRERETGNDEGDQLGNNKPRMLKPWRSRTLPCVILVSSNLPNRPGFAVDWLDSSAFDAVMETDDESEEVSSANDYRRQLYEAFVAERRALNSTLLELTARHDKAILILSGGALGFSVTFLDKIAPHPLPGSKWLLAVSWLCLLASIATQLLALSSSQKAMHRQIEILDREYTPLLYQQLGESTEVDRKNKYRKDTAYWNCIAMWTLIIGIGLLYVFAGWNALERSTTHEQEQADKKPTNASGDTFTGDTRNVHSAIEHATTTATDATSQQ